MEVLVLLGKNICLHYFLNMNAVEASTSVQAFCDPGSLLPLCFLSKLNRPKANQQVRQGHHL